MNFLAIVRRKTKQFSDEEIAKFLEPEAERVRTLYSQGVFRTIWSCGGGVKGAVIQLECASQAEAEQALASLPFSQQGIADIELIPLLPYRGFGPRQS
jgi:muconolactone delta-isomerase